MDYSLKKVVKVVCEGTTEYNYFKELKKIVKGEINLTPIEGEGGGYAKILSKLKKQPTYGSIARFAVIDFDRYFTEHEEPDNFNKLIKYCNTENKKGNPTFIILTNPDFDHFVFSHSPEFKNQKISQFILKYSYRNIDELKKDETIYYKFNNENDSYSIALEKMNKNYPLINVMKLDKNYNFVKPIVKFSENDFNQYIITSNIYQLFELLMK